jgi:phenylalanyl-tRNA synthetase beta chain
VVYNSERRQGDVQLFEVGSVFRIPDEPPGGEADGPRAEITERLSAIFAVEGDDAWTATAAWHTVADALRIGDWVLGDPSELGPLARMVHSHRSAAVSSVVDGADGDGDGQRTLLGAVGELDPTLVGRFGLVEPDGRPRRVGWLDLDVGTLLDRDRVPRRSDEAQPVTRFPSSDIDLAFVVEESIPAGSIERTLRKAGRDLLESIELFDVYRGPSVDDGSRSLAFRLRFSALDRTLTDEEMGRLRTTCIDAVVSAHGARLR